MKILFVITQSEIGGAQRFLLEFAPYLVQRGYDVSVIAGEGGDELRNLLHETWNMKHGTYYTTPNLVRNLNPMKDLLALFYILKIIKKERPDTLFLQSTKAGFLGAFAAKIYKLYCFIFPAFAKASADRHVSCSMQVVYRIGGWSFQDPRPWWANKIIFWMEKVSAPLRDIIIVNSEIDRQLAIDKKIAPSEKIVKIYNGIEPNKLNFLTKEEARSVLVSSIEYLVLSKETKIIGTVANLYATKGIKHLIEAAHHLYQILDTRYQILFIVIGEGKQRPQLEALIEKYNIQDKFFLVGRIPNASQYLKAFDIFVLPSVKEGFPWAVLETMAAGVPIVATYVGAVPEIIEDGKEGFIVPPKDSAALAEKIARIIESPILSQEITKNALERLRYFSAKKMLVSSENIINDQ